MTCTLRQTAAVGCMSILMSGCASHQNIAPEYRLSSSSAELVSGTSMLQRGRAQLGAGLDALAIESFRAEIRQNPGGTDAYNGLAVAYDRIGRPDLAQRYFETALAKDPSNLRVKANLAKLTGQSVSAIQMAADIPELPAVAIKADPVSVVLPIEEDVIGKLLAAIDAPALTLIDAPEPTVLVQARASGTQEIFGNRGILSARFTAAPVQMAAKAPAQHDSDLPLRQPGRKPADPSPSLPLPALVTEARHFGARLDRISLGEVRLITMSEPPASPVLPKSKFASFGERLSIWLPTSIRAEQSETLPAVRDETVMLAAIERAETEQSLAALETQQPIQLQDFAYVMFDSGENEGAV